VPGISVFIMQCRGVNKTPTLTRRFFLRQHGLTQILTDALDLLRVMLKADILTNESFNSACLDEYT